MEETRTGYVTSKNGLILLRFRWYVEIHCRKCGDYLGRIRRRMCKRYYEGGRKKNRHWPANADYPEEWSDGCKCGYFEGINSRKPKWEDIWRKKHGKQN